MHRASPDEFGMCLAHSCNEAVDTFDLARCRRRRKDKELVDPAGLAGREQFLCHAIVMDHGFFGHRMSGDRVFVEFRSRLHRGAGDLFREYMCMGVDDHNRSLTSDIYDTMMQWYCKLSHLTKILNPVRSMFNIFTVLLLHKYVI